MLVLTVFYFLSVFYLGYVSLVQGFIMALQLQQ